jgi:signal transduction histidine kinase
MSLAPLAARLRRLSPRLADLVVTVVVGVPVLAVLLARAIAHDQPWDMLVALVAIPALYLRRRRSFLALGLAIAAAAIIADSGALLLPALVVLYTLGATRGLRVGAAAGAAASLVVVLAGWAWGNGGASEHGGLLGLALSTTAFCAAAVALGLYVGAQRRVFDGLRERAERSDRERELLADRAVAEERIRIARELHDVVAHDLSLMVVQAQALGATEVDERVTEKTREIADLGRDAMAEMHRTLRLLRSGSGETAELEPLPGLVDLDTLLERSRAAGLEIELTIEGQPHALSQTADLSAYRVIQEALTNVIKHAESAPTRIALRYSETGLTVTIRDAGGGENGLDRPRQPGGHGITGMRERVALFGGTLTTVARGGQGFEVVATLPYEDPEA